MSKDAKVRVSLSHLWKWSESRSVVSDSLRPHGLCSPWNYAGQNTGVGSLSLLQDIFPTQGSNPDLLYCMRIVYQLSHRGSPRILEWVTFPFSRGFSQLRKWTGVSCIAGGFFTSWATSKLALTGTCLRMLTVRVSLSHLSDLFKASTCWENRVNS